MREDIKDLEKALAFQQQNLAIMDERIKGWHPEDVKMLREGVAQLQEQLVDGFTYCVVSYACTKVGIEKIKRQIEREKENAKRSS